MIMRALLAAFAAMLALAPAMAVAEDFFEAMPRLNNREFAITGVCTTKYSTQIVLRDVEPGRQSIGVKGPHGTSAGWDAIVASCAAATPQSLTVRLEVDKVGRIEAIYAGSAGASAGTILDVANAILAELKDVTSITGYMDKKNQDLDYAIISPEDGLHGKLVFFSKLAPRRTVDFLAKCFETCDRASFRLHPLAIYDSGIDVFLNASDWEVESGAQ